MRNAMYFLIGMLVAAVAASCMSGCASKPTHNPAQSWDQENLKRNDHGCPTAIYIAPDGNLVQCQYKAIATYIQPVTYPKFDTIEQAAIAGLKAIAAQPSSQYYEYGGAIGRSPTTGKFTFSTPYTDYGGDHVHIDMHDLPPDVIPVAGFHTHPCIADHFVEYFSPPDLMEVIFMGRVTFMGDFCTGHVHEFKPGDNPAVDEVGHGIHLTKGRIIGFFTTAHELNK